MEFPDLDIDKSEIQRFLFELDNSLQILNDLTIEITEIPAAPFKEEIRGEFIATKFKEIGYDVIIDNTGNVIATRNLNFDEPVVILSAHIDTVFQNTDITVEIDGDIMKAPGIGDDSRGLANLILISNILFNVVSHSPIVFIATVGEEGLGDLRGVKSIFDNPMFESERVKAFITIDGTGYAKIVDQGVGSIRYMMDFSGPGGHSYGAFGLVNPSFALGNFLHEFGKTEVPETPKTTFSVGTFEGGTSINSIPERITIAVDMRSEDHDELMKVVRRVKKLAQIAVDIENEARDGDIEVEIDEVGNRPVGKLSENSWFRDILIFTHDWLEIPIEFGASSTDANVPLSKKIPAVSVGGVTEAGRAHSQDEWIKCDKDSLIPVKRNMLLTYFASQYR